MGVKWFCDVCKDEIRSPECPVRLCVYTSKKGRDDSEIGWGESDYIVKAWCHEKCAETLAAKVKAASGL